MIIEGVIGKPPLRELLLHFKACYVINAAVESGLSSFPFVFPSRFKIRLGGVMRLHRVLMKILHFGCGKALGLIDRTRLCIGLILCSVRSINGRSFDASQNIKFSFDLGIPYAFIVSLSALFLTVIPMEGQTKAIEVSQLSQFEDALESQDKSTLVIFNIDYTLLTPEDALLRPCGADLLATLLPHSTKGKWPKDYLLSEVMQKEKFILVDKNFPQVIDTLQKKEIPTIGMNGVVVGKLGLIPSASDWRIDQLKKLGIDFSVAFPKEIDLYAEGDNSERKPAFKAGNIFAAGYSEPDLVLRLLKKLQWTPKKIIYVSDKEGYIDKFEEGLKGSNIDFIGYYYTGIKNLPCKLNERVGRFQFKFLINHGLWLGEAEAEQKIDILYE